MLRLQVGNARAIVITHIEAMHEILVKDVVAKPCRFLPGTEDLGINAAAVGAYEHATIVEDNIPYHIPAAKVTIKFYTCHPLFLIFTA